jgi:hypothetical protein
VATDAIKNVSGGDSVLHHIRRSNLQQEQNVKAVPYRCKDGHRLIVQTTQHIEAGTELFPPQQLSRWISHHTTMPAVAGFGNDNSRSRSCRTSTVHRGSDESSDGSDESDDSEYREVDESGSESDHGEDDTILVKACQNEKSKGKKSGDKTTKPDRTTLHEVLSIFGDNPFSKDQLIDAYRKKKGFSPSTRLLNSWLSQYVCCSSEGRIRGNKWTHHPDRCAGSPASTPTKYLLHYAVSEREELSVTALEKLCEITAKGIREALLPFSCCQYRTNTNPLFYSHDTERCTTQILGIRRSFKDRVRDFQDVPRRQRFTWSDKADKKVLQYEPGVVTFKQVGAMVKSNFPECDFDSADIGNRWRNLEREKMSRENIGPNDIEAGRASEREHV